MNGQRTAIRSPAATVNPMRAPLALHRQPLPTNLAVAMDMEPSMSRWRRERERGRPRRPTPARKHAAARFRKVATPHESDDEAGWVMLTSCRSAVAIHGAHRRHQRRDYGGAATGA